MFVFLWFSYIINVGLIITQIAEYEPMGVNTTSMVRLDEKTV